MQMIWLGVERSSTCLVRRGEAFYSGSVPAEGATATGCGAPWSHRVCGSLWLEEEDSWWWRFFGVWGGQRTCSFVFCMSKEKIGLLAQKDANADRLITLLSFPLQNKIKESYRSVGGQGNQSPLPSPKPPHHACIWPSLELTYFSCKYVYQGTMLPAQGKHFTRAFTTQSQALPNDIDREKYTIFSNAFGRPDLQDPFMCLSLYFPISPLF